MLHKKWKLRMKELNGFWWIISLLKERKKQFGINNFWKWDEKICAHIKHVLTSAPSHNTKTWNQYSCSHFIQRRILPAKSFKRFAGTVLFCSMAALPTCQTQPVHWLPASEYVSLDGPPGSFVLVQFCVQVVSKEWLQQGGLREPWIWISIIPSAIFAFWTLFSLG